MFKCMATDPNTQLTTMQQRQTRAIKNARSLFDGCHFLNDMDNEILFRINILQPLTIAGLEEVDLQLGLPGHWTSHQWTSSYEATLKPWSIHHQLMLKRILMPVLLRQQQPPGSNLTFLSAHISLCCVVSCFTRSVAIHLNICSKLVQNTTFFFPPRIIQWFWLISNLSQTHFNGSWHCIDACLTCSCLTINLCFAPSYHLTKFGHGVFSHSINTHTHTHTHTRTNIFTKMTKTSFGKYVYSTKYVLPC